MIARSTQDLAVIIIIVAESRSGFHLLAFLLYEPREISVSAPAAQSRSFKPRAPLKPPEMLSRLFFSWLTLAVALIVTPGIALSSDSPLLPAGGRVIQGVNFTGSGSDTDAFKHAVENRPQALTFYEKWGTRDQTPFNVWQRTGTLGVISISTGQSHDARHSRISLREIANGGGDGYLLWLNRQMADHRSTSPTYVVLFPEMNGYWNPYSTYSKEGELRSPAYTPEWFRRAWQRVELILNGGATNSIDRKLSKLGMPQLRRGEIPGGTQQSVSYLPEPPVDMIWIPQERGTPDFSDNGPEAYWPGGNYVDWVGLNTFSRWPKFSWLDWFYQNDLWDDKPMAIGEYAVAVNDYPDWVDQLFSWARSHRRVQMMSYYQGFQSKDDPYRIQSYPYSEERLRAQLNNPIIHDPFPDRSRPEPDRGSDRPERVAEEHTVSPGRERSEPAPVIKPTVSHTNGAGGPPLIIWIAIGVTLISGAVYGVWRWRLR